MVVYENEGIRGVNEGGFENFARMRKGLVDRTLRKFFKLDEPKTGIKQDDCEDFTIKGAHFRTESVINAFRVVEMLLGEGIFAGQGAEAQGRNESGGFGLSPHHGRPGRRPRRLLLIQGSRPSLN